MQWGAHAILAKSLPHLGPSWTLTLRQNSFVQQWTDVTIFLLWDSLSKWQMTQQQTKIILTDNGTIDEYTIACKINLVLTCWQKVDKQQEAWQRRWWTWGTNCKPSRQNRSNTTSKHQEINTKVSTKLRIDNKKNVPKAEIRIQL